jgi:hypothetical protein
MSWQFWCGRSHWFASKTVRLSGESVWDMKHVFLVSAAYVANIELWSYARDAHEDLCYVPKFKHVFWLCWNVGSVRTNKLAQQFCSGPVFWRCWVRISGYPDRIFMTFFTPWWARYIWLKIETSGGLLWARKWTFGLHKMSVNYWVVAQRTASQEVLCSIELVCLYLISSRQMSICFSYHIFSYAQPCAHDWINVLYTKCCFLPVTLLSWRQVHPCICYVTSLRPPTAVICRTIQPDTS